MSWSAWQRVPGFDFTDIIYEKKQHVEIQGYVARITMNRPDVYNAFNAHTLDEMKKAFQEASDDVRTGVVVLTGLGGNFSSGGDVRWETTEEHRDQMDPSEESLANTFIKRCKKPVIAAVEGYAIGAGNHMAYTCDFTIATETAVFGQTGPRVGSPAHGWVVAHLALTVGMKKAREIWLLCRQYTAQEALEMGLVNKVVPTERLEAEVDQWCEEMLSLSPTCVQIVKASYDAAFDMFRQFTGPMGQILDRINPQFMDSEERKECQTSFFERRTPHCFKKYVEEVEKRGGPAVTKTQVASPFGSGWRSTVPGSEIWGQ
ncbi:MAG: enoyl-CoA hydratase-related protein [Dehalococcoidia bacterium]|jgi:naphthoate synthase/2-ketocyclohexanecarboxyl-CoA hydrolase|nr:enoyl-CoA hydratase-related protein [Dehalococcoidia bacterium]